MSQPSTQHREPETVALQVRSLFGTVISYLPSSAAPRSVHFQFYSGQIIPKSLKCIHSATKIKALFANSIRRFTQDPTRTNLKPEYYRRQWGCRALSQSDEPSNPSVSKDSAKRRRTPKNLGKPYLPNTLPLPPHPLHPNPQSPSLLRLLWRHRLPGEEAKGFRG